uniref:Uncharacterized protein n=1 Tax=Arundo donax TaxID=35708 RepID=A0A0A8ZTD0_ARUDO
MEPNQFAYALWTRVESLFRNNREARAIYSTASRNYHSASPLRICHDGPW